MAKRKCKHDGCSKPAANKRRECHACKQRNYAKRWPIKYAYQELRNRANKRGKYFDLTLEQFREFVVKTDYMVKKGIYKDSYHIDRIDESKGYTVDNIQLLTNSENISKFLQYDYVNGKFSAVTKKILPDNEKFKDVPF
jgi:hypothetical protein